jgi:hypothetical protein
VRNIPKYGSDAILDAIESPLDSGRSDEADGLVARSRAKIEAEWARYERPGDESAPLIATPASVYRTGRRQYESRPMRIPREPQKNRFDRAMKKPNAA